LALLGLLLLLLTFRTAVAVRSRVVREDRAVARLMVRVGVGVARVRGVELLGKRVLALLLLLGAKIVTAA
jgi:hypothetical protein